MSSRQTMQRVLPLFIMVLVTVRLFGNPQTMTYTPMTDAEALSRFSALEVMTFREQLYDILKNQREVIELFDQKEALRNFDRRMELLKTIGEADYARLMATGVDLTALQKDSANLQQRAAGIRAEVKANSLRAGSDSAGFPNANYSTRCGNIRNTPEAMFDGAVILEGARTVHAALSRACDQVVAGVNTSLLCIIADVVLAAAEGVFNTLQFCDSDIDSAEIEGSYLRMGHLHSDVDSAQTSIINNDNANKTSIVSNDNANKTTIVDNDNSNKASIINNDTGNKDAIVANDNANKDSIVANDNTNKDTIVGNDNSNRSGIVINDDSNREIILSRLAANVTTITGAVDANTTAIVGNSNANKNAIILNEDTNKAAIVANDNANKSFIVSTDNTNRDAIISAILANANANRDLLIQELRTLGCDIIRLVNTPEGQRSSDLLACTSQPGFPYAFPEKKLTGSSTSIAFKLPANEVRETAGRDRSVIMETFLAEGRLLPSYYLPAERGGLIENVRDLVWNTIASQSELQIAPQETAAARSEALKGDELLAAGRFVDAYRQYSAAYRNLIPKS